MQTPRRWIAGVEPPAELLGATGTQVLEHECREQPARLAALLEAYATDSSIEEQLASLRRAADRSAEPVLWLGMGGSFCSAIAGATHLASHGRAAFAVDAGEWIHYGLPSWRSPLSVLLTTSGESAELVELFRRADDRTLALISNNPASTCWQLARYKLPILAGPEYGNATKTYTNSTAASILLASALLGRPAHDDARLTLKVFTEALDPLFARRAELDRFCQGAANIEIVGRGAAYGAAIMGALTIREMSGFRAAPHTGAGFRHGPNLDTDSSHVAIILAVGRTAALGHKLAQECNRKGGKVLLVTDRDAQPNELLLPIYLPPVPEPWEALTTILVPQALTLAMIERSGCRLPPRFEYGVMEQ
jgi:glutamine---fructose-6-phosphate transaminase (isomerizing)